MNDGRNDWVRSAWPTSWSSPSSNDEARSGCAAPWAPPRCSSAPSPAFSPPSKPPACHPPRRSGAADSQRCHWQASSNQTIALTWALSARPRSAGLAQPHRTARQSTRIRPRPEMDISSAAAMTGRPADPSSVTDTRTRPGLCEIATPKVPPWPVAECWTAFVANSLVSRTTSATAGQSARARATKWRACAT